MTEPARNTRKLLLDAAIAEFAESGYAGARTDRIASDAGVNKQLIFYYFGSKAGLYDAVLQDAQRRLAAERDGVTAAARGPDALRRLFRAVFEVLVAERAVTRLIARGLREPEPMGAAARAAVSDLVDRFAAVISDGQGTGYFRDEVDPKLAAQQAVVLSLGYLGMSAALNGDGPSGEIDHGAWLESASQLLVRSLIW